MAERTEARQNRANLLPTSDLKVETRIGVKRKPRRILSIVSSTAEIKGFPVGFFAEEMTRAFLMFTKASIMKLVPPPDWSRDASFL